MKRASLIKKSALECRAAAKVNVVVVEFPDFHLHFFTFGSPLKF